MSQQPPPALDAFSTSGFSSLRVLCVGDVMVDRFADGSVTRISPERPVPVFNLTEVVDVAGGAANVARNVAALGGHCTLVGVVGDDAAAEHLVAACEAGLGVDARLVVEQGRPTTEKTRFVTQGNHVLRVDRESSAPISENTVALLLDVVESMIDDVDVVVLSDYAKGVLTDAVIAGVTAIAGARGVKVIVDPKSRDFSRYAGATVLTPNTKEAEVAVGFAVDNDEDAARAALALVHQAQAAAIVLTRGEHGMTVVEATGEAIHVPTSARTVYDVVGAGDTVVATLALALAAGFGFGDAAAVANAAAGLAVAKRGTATVTADELSEELASLSTGHRHVSASRVLSISDAAEYARRHREAGERIGFTNGVFDIIHPGHIRILDFSRAHCDRLIVGINSDESVRRLKGPERPFNPAGDRAEVLTALGSVDVVVVFDDDTPLSLIEAVGPDVLVKGSDYNEEQIVGSSFVRARGGQVLRYELLAGRSTTLTMDRIRSRAGATAQ